MPEIFNPKVRPWVKMYGSTTERIMEKVQKCPSGALSFYKNEGATAIATQLLTTRVEVLKSEPLMVYESITVKDISGNNSTKEKATAFCRCGQSGNKPYCDGSHMKVGFRD